MKVLLRTDKENMEETLWKRYTIEDETLWEKVYY